VSAQVEPKGISGRLVIRASTNQFYSQGSKSPSHKHKLPETVSTELTLLLVNFVEAYPPRILLWNRPSAHTTIQLKGGSGHFYIDMSESGKNVNINYNDDGSSGTKSVELKPIRTSGNFKLPIYDLCIQHRLDVPVRFVFKPDKKPIFSVEWKNWVFLPTIFFWVRGTLNLNNKQFR
jgi:hypothetical protein